MQQESGLTYRISKYVDIRGILHILMCYTSKLNSIYFGQVVFIHMNWTVRFIAFSSYHLHKMKIRHMHPLLLNFRMKCVQKGMYVLYSLVIMNSALLLTVIYGIVYSWQHCIILYSNNVIKDYESNTCAFNLVSATINK